jgi:hypothetical protein
MRTTALLFAIASAGACAPVASSVDPAKSDAPADLTRDPLQRVDLVYLESRIRRIHGAVLNGLTEAQRTRVANVTLDFDETHGEVNAFATCGRIAISPGLVTIAAHVAMSTAIDDVFKTDRWGARYRDWLERYPQRSPPPDLYPVAMHQDPRTRARRWEIFDEAMAFVIGHELAHHTLGHVACGSAPSTALPVFGQANELAADAAAIHSVLRVNWGEEGAVRLLAAFHRDSVSEIEKVVFSFLLTHPLPAVRMPLIVATAELWHNTGGWSAKPLQ